MEVVNTGNLKIWKLYNYKIELYIVLFFIAKLYNIKMIRKNIINVFIPFIEININKKYIEHIFRTNGFGEIMSIQLFEKKKKKLNKLYSLQHNYAFIELYPFNTQMGNNLIKNIQNNFTTYILFSTNNNVGQWEVKPYLSIQQRMEKGFNIYFKENNCSFYDDIYAKKIVLEEYLELEREINNITCENIRLH